MNVISFNGRMSRKVSECRGSEEKEGKATPPVPLTEEKNCEKNLQKSGSIKI
jgi:hypothetical protein